MLNRKSPHLTLAVLVTAAVIVMAGGAAIASNAGFKINMSIHPFPAGPTTTVGDNWISLPNFNPYTTVAGLCSQTGLASGIVKATITTINPANGNATSVQCGTAAANTTNLIAGRGYRVRQPASVTPPPFSVIIVGSHNPALQIHLEDLVGNGPTGSNWIAIPYHTTAVSFQDFCNSSALTQTQFVKATLTHIDPVTGTPTSVQCGTPAATTTTLVLGRSIRIHEPNGPKDFIPAHY
jgi:hypothetical protein